MRVCVNFIYRNRSNASQWERENFINKQFWENSTIMRKKLHI